MLDAHAEKAILGAMLMDPVAVADASAKLYSDDFGLSSHKIIFQRIVQIAETGRDVDIVSLCSAMSSPEIESIGGRAYLSSLTDGIQRFRTIDAWVWTVKQRSLARRGSIACSQAQQRFLDPTEPADEVLDALVKSCTAERNEDSVTAEDVMPDVLRSLDRQDDDVIPTGIRALDEMTSGGMRPKELWVIGAQPSGGKSSLARQLERSAFRAGFGVHSHSIEVPKEDWVRFHVAHLAQIPVWKLRQAWRMSDIDKEHMRQAALKVCKWNHMIDDSGSVHIRTLLAKSRLSRMRHGIKLYVVDYLQMLNGDGREKRHIMGDAARSLKQFAKDNNCCVIALSQMARKGDINARPSLQDLKESGDIEAAADVALLNFRPKHDDNYTGEDEIIVAKQRNGPIDKIAMRYNPDTLTFDPR